MEKKLLPYFTVKVNNGSGCLFQPTDTNYSYVLTAKHVIEGDDISIIRQTLNDSGDVQNDTLEIIGEPFFHSDENKDAAIIKVQPVTDIDALIRDESGFENKNKYFLCGHPKSRRENNYSFRENGLTPEVPQEHGYIEAELSPAALHGEVVGQSGGGIIKIEGDCYLFSGVQKRMAEQDENESLGRIFFSPISFFDEIVEENNNELSKLYPPYFTSFGIILNNIFSLESHTVNRDIIRRAFKR